MTSIGGRYNGRIVIQPVDADGYVARIRASISHDMSSESVEKYLTRDECRDLAAALESAAEE